MLMKPYEITKQGDTQKVTKSKLLIQPEEIKFMNASWIENLYR